MLGTSVYFFAVREYINQASIAPRFKGGIRNIVFNQNYFTFCKRTIKSWYYLN